MIQASNAEASPDRAANGPCGPDRVNGTDRGHGPKCVILFRKIGSSGWIRTSNPPVNRLMQVVYPVGSSMVYLTLDRRCSLVFGTKLFTDCSLPIRSTAEVTRPIRIRRGRTICGPQGLSGAPACGATHRGWLEAWGLPRLTGERRQDDVLAKSSPLVSADVS
jgi:hypothetical protein